MRQFPSKYDARMARLVERRTEYEARIETSRDKKLEAHVVAVEALSLDPAHAALADAILFILGRLKRVPS